LLSFFEELKRRNVFRVGVAYGVAGWVILQVADLVLEAIEAPAWVLKALLLVVAIGFVVALVVSWAYEMTPEGIKKEADVDRSQSITADTGRKMDKIIIGFLAIAVVLLLTDRFLGKPASDLPQPSSATAESPPVPDDAIIDTPEKSIAVLPFSNMSEDASNEFFADGISEEILNALAKVRELKVAGRTSAFAFKGRNEDLREIGEALGVNHILEGSVRKAGNTVRVTAQLIQVSDGFHMWSDTYDRELTDIFAIQDEISNAILAAMKAELIGDQSISSTRSDPLAYEKYVVAKQRIYSRNPIEMEAGLKLLDDVIAIDPNLASAWAQRGIATLLLSEWQYGTIPRGEAEDTGMKFLRKSLELDPNLAEGHAGMGLYYNNLPGKENLDLGIESLQKALALNPSLINASNWLQSSLQASDKISEAREILEDMVSRDPFYRPAIGNLLFLYVSTGDYSKAEAIINRVRPYMHDDPFMSRFEANLLSNQGRYAEALPLAKSSLERAPTDSNSIVQTSIALVNLAQFEELAALETPFPTFKLIALAYIERVEEGTLLGQQEFSKTGFPNDLINFLSMSEKHDELAGLIDEHWPDLAKFSADYKPLFGLGYGEMLGIAYAYMKTGNQQRFEQAMNLTRIEHDKQLANGADMIWTHFSEARYWTLAGDHEKALLSLEKAIDRGLTGLPRLSKLTPEFKELEGDPRYEALHSRALENLNTQRKLLELEPLEAEYSL
jgi:TolB-like protein